MKRDMDLIREILIEVEKVPALVMWESRPLLGYNDEEVFAHIELAREAGLVEASLMSGACAIIQRITNDGYDFLEASKQPTLWQQAKDRITAAGLPVTIAVAKTVLQTLVNDALAKLR
jgi:hypothetical protein